MDSQTTSGRPRHEGSLTSNQTTIHHTLWAFNKTRNPRGRSEEPATRGEGGPLDWVNNVISGAHVADNLVDGHANGMLDVTKSGTDIVGMGVGDVGYGTLPNRQPPRRLRHRRRRYARRVGDRQRPQTPRTPPTETPTPTPTRTSRST